MCSRLYNAKLVNVQMNDFTHFTLVKIFTNTCLPSICGVFGWSKTHVCGFVRQSFFTHQCVQVGHANSAKLKLMEGLPATWRSCSKQGYHVHVGDPYKYA